MSKDSSPNETLSPELLMGSQGQALINTATAVKEIPSGSLQHTLLPVARWDAEPNTCPDHLLTSYTADKGTRKLSYLSMN